MCVQEMVLFSRPRDWLYREGTCHDYAHTWHPSCLYCAGDIFVRIFRNALKVYAPLYLLSDLLRRRHPSYIVRHTIPHILQSTVFLAANGGAFLSFICLVRRLIGRFYFYSAAFLPAFLGTLVAILVERKSRRGLLMGYVCTLAVEVLYCMLKHRGYVSPLPCGEVMIFSFASAVLLHSYKSKPGLHDSSGAFLGLLFRPWMPAGLTRLVGTLSAGPPSLKNQLTLGVLNVAWIALWSFLVGYLIQAGFAIVSSLTKIFKQPGRLKRCLLRPYNAKFGAFLATLAGGFKALNALIFLLPISRDLRLVLAGLLAGLSMLCIRSSPISLYVAGKALEVLYFKAVGKGWLPRYYYGDAVIYAISCAILFHAAFFESHNMRPSYWEFLYKITDGRALQLNFEVLDHFGTNATKRIKEIKEKMGRQKELESKEKEQ